MLDFADEPLAMAGRLLAELGGRVIRVESSAGDWLRRRGPFVHGRPGLERSLAHIQHNAGKQSLSVDFGRDETWEVMEKLAARVDILIAPIEPSPRAKAFLAPEHLERISPGLGVVEAVFRRDSDETAVSDIVGAAAGGFLKLNGYPEDPPNHAALILQKAATGKGGRITVSMQEAMMWTTIQTANENYWYWHQQRPSRTGIAGLGGRTIYETADGLWVSFYQHPPSWPAFVSWVREVLGDSPFDAPEWDDGLHRLRNFGTIAEVTERLCTSMGRAALVDEAQRRSILVVPVQGAADIASDPHLRARGFFQKVPYPQIGEELEVLRSAFRSTAYDVPAAPAPALGEHSVEVLRDVGGFGMDEIEGLVREGVVFARDGVATR
jgi:crotonobetainyl-CoA:carnitine CoA-transferase CaiB-like acyl-CoA transferase